MPNPSPSSSMGRQSILLSEFENNIGRSRAPSEVNSGASYEKMGNSMESNLQQAMEEQEMLWESIQKIDTKLRENGKTMSTLQSQIEHTKRAIIRFNDQIGKAKQENRELQSQMNSLLFSNLNQYPL